MCTFLGNRCAHRVVYVGKPREGETRTTVFKRQVDKMYNLKMKASRQFYSDVSKKAPVFPFTLRY